MPSEQADRVRHGTYCLADQERDCLQVVPIVLVTMMSLAVPAVPDISEQCRRYARGNEKCKQEPLATCDPGLELSRNI
jgi:hypothetical protein